MWDASKVEGSLGQWLVIRYNEGHLHTSLLCPASASHFGGLRKRTNLSVRYYPPNVVRTLSGSKPMCVKLVLMTL
jgi:hypothetical protein